MRIDLHLGQEFQAVFLSTTEAVDAQGNTSNPTKSPCDRYVFNRVLTRAKALVVAVGSPLALLRIESYMVKRYKDTGRCWSLYLKSCLKKNTIIIPPNVAENEKKKEEFIAKLSALLSATDIPQTLPPRSSLETLSAAVKETSTQTNNSTKIPNTASKVHSYKVGLGFNVSSNTAQQKTLPKAAKSSSDSAVTKSMSLQQRDQANQGNCLKPPLPSHIHPTSCCSF